LGDAQPSSSPRRDAVLKSYEAVYEDGKLSWIRDQPHAKRMRVIVTVLEEETSPQASADRAILLERTRGCVTPPKSIAEIDNDIRKMRAEWEREWDR
jgi:hypothetical protein